MTPASQKNETQPGRAGSQDALTGTPGKIKDAAIAFSRGYGNFDNTPEQSWVQGFTAFRDAIIADRAEGRGQQWVAGPCGIAPDDDFHRADKAKTAAVGRPHRCKACALPRRWVGLDVDGGTSKCPGLTSESFSYLVLVLQGYSGLVYTTSSHSPDAPRCRVILELDRTLPRDELIRATAAFRARVDELMIAGGYGPLPWDSSCDKPEQPLYLPLTVSDVYLTEGRPLSADELLASADAKSQPERRETVVAAAPPLDSYSLRALGSAVQAIADAPEGTRNDVINREAYGLGGFVGAGRLPRPLVESVLVHTTRDAGWDNPEKTEATIRGAIASGSQTPRIDGLTAPMVFGQPEERPDRLSIVDLAGLRSAQVEPPSFVINPLIPRGTLTLFGGHGGSGKSLLALIWAAHVACGRDWAGFRCSGAARVLFASLEDPGQVVLYRLRAIAEGYNLDYDAIAQNLLIVDGADLDAVLVTEVSELGTKKLRPTARLNELAELAQGVDLIVIDNASDTYDGDENNRRQVRYFNRQLARMARENNAGLVLLAHIDKNAAIHGGRGNSYSGSTAWHNSARSRLALEGGKHPVLRHEKANLSAVAEPLVFDWRPTAAGARILVPAQSDNAGADAAVIREAEDDAGQILQVMSLAAQAEVEVPAATSGPATAAHALMLMKELPAVYRTKDGRQRIRMAITELLRRGKLRKSEVKTGNRNTKLLLELTQAGTDEAARLRASIPHTPSVTDARALERASVDLNHQTHASDATHATDAPRGFVFSQHSPGVLVGHLEGVMT